MQAERDDRDRVDRHRHTVDTRGQDVRNAVATQRRDSARVQPWQTRRVETREHETRIPRTPRLAQRPPTRAHEQDVAGFDAKAGVLLGALEIVGKDRLAILQERNAARARHVEQNTARDDTVAKLVNAEFERPVRRHVLDRVAVVQLALVEDVAERVDVRGGESVGRDREVVAAPSFRRGPGHVVSDRVRILEARLRRQCPRRRHDTTAAHQPRRRRAFLGRDQIQGAELIPFPEAPPVRECLVEGEHLLGGERRRIRARGHPAPPSTTRPTSWPKESSSV